MKLTLIAPNASFTEGGTSWVSGQTREVSEAVGKKLIEARPEIWSTDGKGHVAPPVAEQVASPVEPNKTPEALAAKKKPNLATPPKAYKPPPKDETPDETPDEPEPHKRGSRPTK